MTSEEKKRIMCVPGDRLKKTFEKINSGNGTYVKDEYIYACLAGVVNVRDEQDGHKTIEVIRGSDKMSKTPCIGSIVTCKVLQISFNQARCSIHCIEEYALKQSFRGIIRKQDVQALDKNKVEIHKCFRPGDIILARVFGTENNSFLLTTAANELGVVVAMSDAGVAMVPVSWSEMICPKTFSKQPRKVAKIVQNSSVEKAS